MDVFVLAGQSNMAGRGGIVTINGTKMFIETTTPPDPTRIKCFTSKGTWEAAQDPLHDEALDPG